jgi:hypothetical protein
VAFLFERFLTLRRKATMVNRAMDPGFGWTWVLYRCGVVGERRLDGTTLVVAEGALRTPSAAGTDLGYRLSLPRRPGACADRIRAAASPRRCT